MPKLPSLSGNDMVKILENIGFKLIRQKGSHVSLQKKTDNHSYNVVVPMHKELAKGTLLSIIRQAGYTKEEFLKLL